MMKSNADDIDAWTEIYEATKTNGRTGDVDAAIAKAARMAEELEAEAVLIEQRLQSAPPPPLPDEYPDDRKKPAQLRAKRDAWRAFREHIREETGR